MFKGEKKQINFKKEAAAAGANTLGPDVWTPHRLTAIPHSLIAQEEYVFSFNPLSICCEVVIPTPPKFSLSCFPIGTADWHSTCSPPRQWHRGHPSVPEADQQGAPLALAASNLQETKALQLTPQFTSSFTHLLNKHTFVKHQLHYS